MPPFYGFPTPIGSAHERSRSLVGLGLHAAVSIPKTPSRIPGLRADRRGDGCGAPTSAWPRNPSRMLGPKGWVEVNDAVSEPALFKKFELHADVVGPARLPQRVREPSRIRAFLQDLETQPAGHQRMSVFNTSYGPSLK